MRNVTIKPYQKLFCLVLGGISFISPVIVDSAAASTRNADSNEQAVRRRLPGRRISGGSRLPNEACTTGSDPLVAMIPSSNLGLTTEAQPKVWFHIPTVREDRTLQFRLFDSNNDMVYEANLAAPAVAGLASVDLATMEQAPHLAQDQRYRWSFSIVCDAENPSKNLWVEGWIQRVTPDVADTGSIMTDTVGHSLWYESFSRWIEESQNAGDVSDWQAQWQYLLTAIDLEESVPTTPPLQRAVLSVTEVARLVP